MRTRLAAASALTLVAAVAAGCGGGDAPSKAEFVKKADAICAKESKQTDAKAKRLTAGKPSKAQLTSFIRDDALPAVQKEIDDIKELDTPKGDDDKVKSIVDAAQKAIDKTKADPGALLAGGNADPFQQADKLATDYGLKKCGSDG